MSGKYRLGAQHMLADLPPKGGQGGTDGDMGAFECWKHPQPPEMAIASRLSLMRDEMMSHPRWTLDEHVAFCREQMHRHFSTISIVGKYNVVRKCSINVVIEPTAGSSSLLVSRSVVGQNSRYVMNARAIEFQVNSVDVGPVPTSTQPHSREQHMDDGWEDLDGSILMDDDGSSTPLHSRMVDSVLSRTTELVQHHHACALDAIRKMASALVESVSKDSLDEMWESLHSQGATEITIRDVLGAMSSWRWEEESRESVASAMNAYDALCRARANRTVEPVLRIPDVAVMYAAFTLLSGAHTLWKPDGVRRGVFALRHSEERDCEERMASLLDPSSREHALFLLRVRERLYERWKPRFRFLMRQSQEYARVALGDEEYDRLVRVIPPASPAHKDGPGTLKQQPMVGAPPKRNDDEHQSTPVELEWDFSRQSDVERIRLLHEYARTPHRFRITHASASVPIGILSALKFNTSPSGALDLLICLGCVDPLVDPTFYSQWNGPFIQLGGRDDSSAQGARSPDAKHGTNDGVRDQRSSSSTAAARRGHASSRVRHGRVRYADGIERVDMSHTRVFTIDPAGTTEVDDGISWDEGTNTAWVHVADPSARFPLDMDQHNAYLSRPSSLYLAEGRYPMMSHRDVRACSIERSNEVNQVLSFGLSFASDGSLDGPVKVQASTISGESVFPICYGDVEKMLAAMDSDQDVQSHHMRYNPLGGWEEKMVLEPHEHAHVAKDARASENESSQAVQMDHHHHHHRKDIEEDLRVLYSIAKRRRAFRTSQGVQHIQFPHPSISLGTDEEGRVQTRVISNLLLPYEGRSHSLVEEFMVAAGDGVGRLALANGWSVPYRRHLPPNPDVLHDVNWYLSNKMDQDQLNSMTPYQRNLFESQLLVKAQQPASYTAHPHPHHSLGIPAYVQVTSPMRRYSDYMAHRQIKRYLFPQSNERGFDDDGVELAMPRLNWGTQIGSRIMKSNTIFWSLFHLREFVHYRRDQAVEAVVLGMPEANDVLYKYGLNEKGSKAATIHFPRLGFSHSTIVVTDDPIKPGSSFDASVMHACPYSHRLVIRPRG